MPTLVELCQLCVSLGVDSWIVLVIPVHIHEAPNSALTCGNWGLTCDNLCDVTTMVEVAGIEPASAAGESGLLRAQCVQGFS